MFCTVHVHCMHIAGYSAHHSARPQDSVITTYFPNVVRNKKDNKIFVCFLVHCPKKRLSHGIYSVLWRCTVACTARVAFCLSQKHALCAILFLKARADSTARHARHTASDLLFPCGANAALLLCLRVLWRWKCVWLGVLSSAKENLFKFVCAHPNFSKTNLVASLLVGRCCEDDSVFGLRLWQVEKGVCSSLCWHIQKPKTNCPVLSYSTMEILLNQATERNTVAGWNAAHFGFSNHPTQTPCFFFLYLIFTSCTNCNFPQRSGQESSVYMNPFRCMYIYIYITHE